VKITRSGATMNEQQEIDQKLEAAVEPEPNRIEPDDDPVGEESLETIQEDEQRQVQFEPDPVEVKPSAAMEETGKDHNQCKGVCRSARVRVHTQTSTSRNRRQHHHAL